MKAEPVEVLHALQEMYSSGQVDFEVFSKTVIETAGELVKVGDVEAAITYISSLPVEYFQSTMIRQMEEDGDFKRHAEDTITTLALLGRVPSSFATWGPGNT